MLRARNILILIIVNYLVLIVVSGYIELNTLASKAKNVQTTIRTAADIALQQAQVIDDFLGYGGRESYKLLMPSSSGNGFVLGDLFGGVFGLDSSVESNTERIFDRMYNNNDFKMLATRLDAMRRPVRYWNLSHTNFDWYYIPQVAMMGTDFLPNTPSITGVKDTRENYIPDSLANELYSVYGLTEHKKTSGGKEYYNTPLNLGITYLNEELLGTLFMNNLDLLMRTKYEYNLNTAEGGNGLLEGNTYADKIVGSLDAYNPINNGIFTLLRGTKNSSTPSYNTYRGVKPLVVYKVIDMYDSNNDNLLIHLFGADTGGFPSKAEYLKDLDRNVINPATGRPFDRKPIVVAKVTFYVDVVVPYFSIVMRELRGSVGDGTTNFLEVLPESPDGVEGTRRIAYTTFFGVTP